MMYDVEFKSVCKKRIKSLCKKNPVLRKAIEKKITEIRVFPDRFKPLKNILKNERRVHIMNCFVLRFSINKERKVITLLFFGHHDSAYK
jgi:mRNA-degrading endonuclease RelE of RelBE toxin-antitoxin system